jgi:hypothetical protein
MEYNKHIVNRIASIILADEYKYIYDPEHRNKPRDGEFFETDRGWSNDPRDKKTIDNKYTPLIYNNKSVNYEPSTGNWHINRLPINQEWFNKGRPFKSQQEAYRRAIEIYHEENENKSEIENHIRRNKNVDTIADKNETSEIDPIEGDARNKISYGDRVGRIVYNVVEGQDIIPNNISSLGLKGVNPNVFGLHFGDTDYWGKRLEKDYGRTGGRIIEIIVKDGDRIVDDPQYSTDPDTGEKADSSILLTSRNKLKYGEDWVWG